MTIQYGGVAALGGLQTAEVYVSEAIVAGLSGLGGLTTLLTDKRGRGGNNDGNEDQNSAENDGNSEESGSRDDEPPDDLQPPLVHDPRVVGNYSFDDLVAELVVHQEGS